MNIGLAFWILMLIWAVLGAVGTFPLAAGNGRAVGSSVLLFVVIALLGWATFGAPLHS